MRRIAFSELDAMPRRTPCVECVVFDHRGAGVCARTADVHSRLACAAEIGPWPNATRPPATHPRRSALRGACVESDAANGDGVCHAASAGAGFEPMAGRVAADATVNTPAGTVRP